MAPPGVLAEKPFRSYIGSVNCLTKQERRVLGIVLALLLTGLAVKAYRTAHPARGDAGHRAAVTFPQGKP